MFYSQKSLKETFLVRRPKVRFGLFASADTMGGLCTLTVGAKIPYKGREIGYLALDRRKNAENLPCNPSLTSTRAGGGVVGLTQTVHLKNGQRRKMHQSRADAAPIVQGSPVDEG